MSHTPGPWQVKYYQSSHCVGSPYCRETCGKKPEVVILETRPAAGSDRPCATEVHVVENRSYVEDIVDSHDAHVVCLGGHEYDDCGNIGVADALLIAASPDLLAACKAALGAFENNNCIDWNDLTLAIAKAEGKP